MSSTEQDFYMVDLNFSRVWLATGEYQTIGTTAYSPEQRESEISDLTAQGWTLTSEERI